MQSLLHHFSKYIKVTDQLSAEIFHRAIPKSFRKGEMIHNAHTICTQSHFINTGLLRLYFLKDGKEVSDYFCSENEWINSPRSFMFREVDHYYIDALEPTEAFTLSVSDLGYLFDNFPEMERYARLSMGSLFYQMIERIASLRFTSAKDKYLHFKKTYADIYPRIPLGMAASYLGITQETLSRLRAEK